MREQFNLTKCALMGAACDFNTKCALMGAARDFNSMWRITHPAIENVYILLLSGINPAMEKLINEIPDVEVSYLIDNKWMPYGRETASSPR
jgi:hypothetical protein